MEHEDNTITTIITNFEVQLKYHEESLIKDNFRKGINFQLQTVIHIAWGRMAPQTDRERLDTICTFFGRSPLPASHGRSVDDHREGAGGRVQRTGGSPGRIARPGRRAGRGRREGAEVVSIVEPSRRVGRGRRGGRVSQRKRGVSQFWKIEVWVDFSKTMVLGYNQGFLTLLFGNPNTYTLWFTWLAWFCSKTMVNNGL